MELLENLENTPWQPLTNTRKYGILVLDTEREETWKLGKAGKIDKAGTSRKGKRYGQNFVWGF